MPALPKNSSPSSQPGSKASAKVSACDNDPGSEESSPRAVRRVQSVPIILLVLSLGTLICYWPLTHHGFVNVDDDLYIYDNPHIEHGFTAAEISWAFRTFHAGNWHPVTWLSHMLDYQLFGLRAGAHHFVNLLFHIANSLLVFFGLRQMTGARWRSALVAGLFAWHPLHIESVAWASERKDVLSTFFWLLATMAYLRYTRGETASSKAGSAETKSSARSSIFYILTLLLFSLGLLSKPMVVTFPCVLLLLDFWPLGRFSSSEAIKRLIIEKIPFFVLTAGVSALTCIVQKGAAASLEQLSLATRLANALLAYCGYLSKTFWPVHLAALYPIPTDLPVIGVIVAALVLAGATAWFTFRWKQQPWLIVGWLWFLGTLVPTIGLVQVGAQAMADRYMYIPSIGLFLVMVWGGAAIAERFSGTAAPSASMIAGAGRNRLAASVVGALALLLCIVLTRAQLSSWQDSTALFLHAAEVTTDNVVAYDHLGKAFMDQGKLEESARWFAKAVAVTPDDAEAHYKVGTVRLLQSRLDEAIAEFSAALRFHPDYAEAHANIAMALMNQGKFREGTAHFAETLRIRPSPEAHANLGLAHLQSNESAEAIKCFNESLRLQPNSPGTQYLLALALASQKDHSVDATAAAKKARELAMAAGQTDLVAKANALLDEQAPGRSNHSSSKLP